MKKTVKAIVFMLVVAITTFSLVACKKPQEIDGLNDLGTLDYRSFAVAEGLDSIEVFNKALNYLETQENFSYEILFNFTTDINVAMQASHDIVKKNGSNAWHEQVVVGTGQGKSHMAALRYYNDNSALTVANDPKGKDAKRRVPGFDIKDNKDLFAYDLSDISPVEIKGVVPKYEYCANFDTYAEYMYDRVVKFFWLYNIGKDDLSESHNTKVYKKGDYYYCDITIDTLNCVKEKNQADVVKDIENGIGMKINGFKHDTILRLRLESVGDSFRLVDTRLEEGYKSTLTGASQNFQRKYSYAADKYEITSNDLKLFNLN